MSRFGVGVRRRCVPGVSVARRKGERRERSSVGDCRFDNASILPKKLGQVDSAARRRARSLCNASLGGRVTWMRCDSKSGG